MCDSRILDEINTTRKHEDVIFLAELKSILYNKEKNKTAFLDLLDSFPGKKYNIERVIIALDIIFFLNKNYPGEVSTAFIVGSVGGGYCKNDYKERILVTPIGKEKNKISELVLEKTLPLPSDLDLDIIFRNPAKIKLDSFEHELKVIIKKHGFKSLPLDIRFISQEDSKEYLEKMNSKPNYLLFRLAFATPLCIYNLKEFEQLRSVFIDTRARLSKNKSPEYRLWEAFKTEKKLFDYLKHKSQAIIRKNELKKIGDLYWLFSLKVNGNSDSFNISSFPPRKSCESIKIKINYS